MSDENESTSRAWRPQMSTGGTSRPNHRPTWMNISTHSWMPCSIPNYRQRRQDARIRQHGGAPGLQGNCQSHAEECQTVDKEDQQINSVSGCWLPWATS